MTKVTTISVKTQFGRNVRMLRTAKSWTQQDLADRVGCHRITIVRIEKGYHTPTYPEACRIADALNCDVGCFRRDLRSA